MGFWSIVGDLLAKGVKTGQKKINENIEKISISAIEKLDKQVHNYTSYVRKAQEDTSHHNMYSYESGQTYAAMEQKEPATASLKVSHTHPSLMSALQKQQKQQTAISVARQSSSAGR